MTGVCAEVQMRNGQERQGVALHAMPGEEEARPESFQGGDWRQEILDGLIGACPPPRQVEQLELPGLEDCEMPQSWHEVAPTVTWTFVEPIRAGKTSP